MINLINKILSCYRYTPLLMAFIALSALGMALMSQYVFGLKPCNLCILQRYPYGIVIVLGLVAFLLSCAFKKSSVLIMVLMGITFLANSVIAFYHSGVELKWWKSFLEGCNAPDLSGDIKDLMARIEADTEVVRCDKIPWADPIFNLSMANYNVIFCFGLGIVSFYSAVKIYQRSGSTRLSENK